MCVVGYGVEEQEEVARKSEECGEEERGVRRGYETAGQDDTGCRPVETTQDAARTADEGAAEASRDTRGRALRAQQRIRGIYHNHHGIPLTLVH